MWTVHEGDALDVLRKLPDCSAHALVTDPPAGISFMGREWDGDKGGRAQWVAWLAAILTEARRVLRPGAHALVWALPRTSHWTACALEDAGFEVRDVLVHLHGQGFPKNLDVSKAIDKAAGAPRPVVGTRKLTGKARVLKGGNFDGGYDGRELTEDYALTAPATDAAATWQGWGTALKPAAEHWILARVPLEGTVASNVLEHGTGAINVDGCRVGSELITAHGGGVNGQGRTYARGAGIPAIHVGRWPANVVLSGDAPELLDAQSGEREAGVMPARASGMGYHGGAKGTHTGVRIVLDSGGASRFFYCPKAATSERYAHLSCNCETPDLTAWESAPDAAPSPHTRAPRGSSTLDLFAELSATTPAKAVGAGVVVPAGSPLSVRRSVCAKCSGAVRSESHPTQKPVELMRWLVRLVTPPGGTVLDCFAGSGTTLLACLAEGMDCIGIERQPEYAALARERAHTAAPLLQGR